MRILIIGFTNIKYMPYLSFYLNEIQDNNSADVLYWNRDGKKDISICNIHKKYEFSKYIEDSYPISRKIPKFIAFRKYALSVLRSNRYDKLIILHSTPGVLLADYIHRNYKGKYILDYRDVTYEKLLFYKNLISRLVNESFCTFVSSRGFVEYLPKSDKLFFSHNLQYESLEHRGKRNRIIKSKSPINICFWGFIRQVDINLRLIEKLGNDMRFELHYYGREQAEALTLKSFCKEKKYFNVFFHGEYMPQERYEFAECTDIIHNLYSQGKTEGIAMGNKFYDGLIFSIPQICNYNSVMGKIVSKENIGIECDINDGDIAETIYNYYKNINWDNFDEKCEGYLNKVLEEWNIGKRIIRSFFLGDFDIEIKKEDK